MGQPVVHVEIIGSDPATLRTYYGELFDWEFQMTEATTEACSQSGNYGFLDSATTGGGINGGVGGGEGYEQRVLFYVGVPRSKLRLKGRRPSAGSAGWDARALPETSSSGSSLTPKAT